MGVANFQECPQEQGKRVWIDDFKYCSEAGRCQKNCLYNKKPADKKLKEVWSGKIADSFK